MAFGTADQPIICLEVCEMDPGFFHDCDSVIRNLHGRLEILAVSVHVEGDTHVDHFDDHEDAISVFSNEATSSVALQSEKLQKQNISPANEARDEQQVKQSKCSTCNADVGDAKQYREHFKSEWHKLNLKRKTLQLPPLSAEDCLADMELSDFKTDLKEYSF